MANTTVKQEQELFTYTDKHIHSQQHSADDPVSPLSMAH